MFFASVSTFYTTRMNNHSYLFSISVIDRLAICMHVHTLFDYVASVRKLYVQLDTLNIHILTAFKGLTKSIGSISPCDKSGDNQRNSRSSRASCGGTTRGNDLLPSRFPLRFRRVDVLFVQPVHTYSVSTKDLFHPNTLCSNNRDVRIVIGTLFIRTVPCQYS